MRNQKGITLVALVVTIVVLLILAGTSIAMLSGDSGIITNAQKSSYANTEGEAMDKIKFAFNALATEVRVKSVTELNYNATEKVKDLAQIAFTDLGGADNAFTSETSATIDNYTVSYEGTKITIVYKDNIFKNSVDDESITDGKFKQIKYDITVTPDGASLSNYTRQVN